MRFFLLWVLCLEGMKLWYRGGGGGGAEGKTHVLSALAVSPEFPGGLASPLTSPHSEGTKGEEGGQQGKRPFRTRLGA